MALECLAQPRCRCCCCWWLVLPRGGRKPHQHCVARRGKRTSDQRRGRRSTDTAKGATAPTRAHRSPPPPARQRDAAGRRVARWVALADEGRGLARPRGVVAPPKWRRPALRNAASAHARTTWSYRRRRGRLVPTAASRDLTAGLAVRLPPPKNEKTTTIIRLRDFLIGRAVAGFHQSARRASLARFASRHQRRPIGRFVVPDLLLRFARPSISTVSIFTQTPPATHRPSCCRRRDVTATAP